MEGKTTITLSKEQVSALLFAAMRDRERLTIACAGSVAPHLRSALENKLELITAAIKVVEEAQWPMAGGE